MHDGAIMPVNLSIKNAPDEVVESLKRRAKRNHRSLQGELMAIIEDAAQLGLPRLTPHEVLERARKLGLKTSSSVETIRTMRDERYGH
jgi:antitoxin FitA